MPRRYRREACNTCRQRKLKCDETYPICQRCSKAQRYCDRSGRPAHTTKLQDAEPPDPDPGAPLDEVPRKALESSELVNYFRRYINSIAPWYDLSDARCSFSTEVPIIAMDEPLLFSAVIALSAMHVSQTTAPSSRIIAEKYHTRCIRGLINLSPEDPLIEKGVALATTCLLRSYEILAEDRDPNRHLKGAFSLASQLREFPGHPDGGLLHSGFWNYLREDITFSLFGRCPLKMDLNAISLVLGRIINFVFKFPTEDGEKRWETMLLYVKDWLSNLPAYFEPFSRVNFPPLTTLPSVHMLKPCHAASRHYCLVSLAMLVARTQNLVQFDRLISVASSMGFFVDTVTTKEDLVERIGLEVCGIAFTSNEPSVLVNAFGPISYCAKHIRTEAARQEVLGHLMASRKATGWPVKQVISDLQQQWETYEVELPSSPTS